MKTMNDICPCPNLDCPNHGICENCNSRHTRLGYLSYCAFHTILPSIRKIISADPESVAAKKLEALITPQLEAYDKLMKKYHLTKENQDELLKKVAAYSDH